ncbi:hypothetical protein AAC387_Pa09g1842 [Persea americana]
MNKEEKGAVDDMELGSSRIAIALLLLLLTHCCPSFHAEEDMYEIDYRGPETHSYLPPPYGPHTGPNSEVPRTRNTFGNRKEIQDKENKFVQNRG